MADIKKMTKFGDVDAKKGQSTTGQYKDSLFKHIFNEEQRFLELYNAISDKSYPQSAKVELYSNHPLLAKYRDIAGLIGDELVMMCEHQSSINPNMPLRMLVYFADVIRTLIVGEEIYSKTKLEIPTPVFYVLYNGDSAYNKTMLELSDSYKVKGQFFTIDMRVKVININPEYREVALRKSPWLGGYAQLIDKIREYLEVEYTRDKSIQLAINWCIENDILAEYLKENHERVVKMLNYDLTQEQWAAIQKKDGKAEVAKKMFLKGEPLEKIREFTELEDMLLGGILSELPQEIRDKYEL